MDDSGCNVFGLLSNLRNVVVPTASTFLPTTVNILIALSIYGIAKAALRSFLIVNVKAELEIVDEG